MFDKRALRRIFVPKRNEVSGGWRKLHNGELHSLYPSSVIIRVIKSIRVRWAGHVSRMERLEMLTKFWLRRLNGRDHSENPVAGCKIIY
jgi:hypothetical protein